jgi:hypothetical protein
MKMLVKIILATLVALPLGNAHAEYAYYICDVEHVGAHSNGKKFIQLFCPDIGEPTWHTFIPEMESEGMALGMTALALVNKVSVQIDPNVRYSDLRAIFLKKK